MPNLPPSPYSRFPFTAQIGLGLMATSASAYLAVRYGSPSLITFVAGAASMFLVMMIIKAVPKKARRGRGFTWPWARSRAGKSTPPLVTPDPEVASDRPDLGRAADLIAKRNQAPKAITTEDKLKRLRDHPETSREESQAASAQLDRKRTRRKKPGR